MNYVAVNNNRIHVKSDTVKLFPFQDDLDMDLEDVCAGEAPELDIQTIETIAAPRSSLNFSESSISSDIIQTVINSITSQAITPNKQALEISTLS